MEARIVSIGNSKGVRLPAALLKQYDLKDTIEITPTPEGILIQPARKKARDGWAEQIKAEIDLHGPEPTDHDWLSFPNANEDTEWVW